MSGTMRVICPHCSGPSLAGYSRQLTPIYREQSFSCKEPTCGHVFIVGITALRTVSPSAAPHPDIRLPYSENVRRRELAASLLEDQNASK